MAEASALEQSTIDSLSNDLSDDRRDRKFAGSDERNLVLALSAVRELAATPTAALDRPNRAASSAVAALHGLVSSG